MIWKVRNTVRVCRSRNVVFALVPFLFFSCRSMSREASESTIAADNPDSAEEGVQTSDSQPLPTVDSYPDAPFFQYDTSLSTYRRFSGRPDDDARIGGKPIVGFIAKGLSSQGRAVEMLSDNIDLIEKHLLDGTAFEPKSMPKRIILDRLLAFQKKYWRYGPGIEWNPDRVPVEQRVKNAEVVYGRVSTFPELHPQYPKYMIYPLSGCIKRFAPAPWGPLQINYFCMIPAVYRSCMRLYLPSGKDYTPDRIKANPRLYDKEAERPDRELVLASCLAVKGQRDDPLWTRLARDLNFPRDVGIRTGGELFDLVGNNELLDKDYTRNVSFAIGNGISKWVGHKLSDQERASILQAMTDSMRRFYIDQYFDVGGEEVNLYNYIMHAPVFQFKVKDQLAILNSLYATMGKKGPTGDAYWPWEGSTECPLGNYLSTPGLDDTSSVLWKCDPRRFTVNGPAGSSGR